MVTTVTLPDELHARIKTLANIEHRSFNATVQVALERYADDTEHHAQVRESARKVAIMDAELLDRLAQ